MLDILFAGLINGNTYALIALGLSLVIGVANVVNFAHGSMFAIGAMTGWWVTASLGLPLWLGMIAAVLVTGVLGYLVNLLAVRPFSSKAPIGAVLSTIALMIILDNATQIVFGPETRRFDAGLPEVAFALGGLQVGFIDILILVTSIVSMTVLATFLKFTRMGRAIRATSQDREAAAQMGVPVNRTQSFAFIIASALGGLAGVLVAVYFTTINPAQGYLAGISGLAAATLGGLGSLLGAVLGGLLLGVLEAFGVYLWGDAARQLITFGVLLLVLWIRPAGLLGRSSSASREPLTGTFFARARPIAFKRWQVPVLLAIAAALGIPGLLSGYGVQIGVQVVAYSIIALSMVVIGGLAGQLSLGQAGPVAVGAYTTALLMKNLGVPFLPAMLIAGLLSAIVVVLLSAPSWKLSGHYPAIATLATGAVIAAVILVWEPLTGGPRGVSLIPIPEVFGLPIDTVHLTYLLGLVILAGALWVTARLQKSHLGRFWEAIRDDEIAARSAGIATPQYKSLAFGVGGFLAGIGGAYLAGQFGYVDPTIFSPIFSFQIVTIAVLGSMLSPFGAVAGSMVLVGGLELFRVASETRLLIYGLVLLLLIRFRPQGLWTRQDSKNPLIERIRGLRTPREETA